MTLVICVAIDGLHMMTLLILTTQPAHKDPPVVFGMRKNN
jgi:hypothetical protein